MKILNNEYQLNNVLCVGYKNARGNYEIVSGRVYDYDQHFVYLDCSYDFWQLEDTIRIKREDIKYCRRTDNDMWR